MRKLDHAHDMTTRAPDAMAQTFRFKSPRMLQRHIEVLKGRYQTSGHVETVSIRKTSPDTLAVVERYLRATLVPDSKSKRNRNPVSFVHGRIAVEFEVADLRGEVVDGKRYWEKLHLVVVLVARESASSRLLVIADGAWDTGKSPPPGSYRHDLEREHNASLKQFVKALVRDLEAVITTQLARQATSGGRSR